MLKKVILVLSFKFFFVINFFHLNGNTSSYNEYSNKFSNYDHLLLDFDLPSINRTANTINLVIFTRGGYFPVEREPTKFLTKIFSCLIKEKIDYMEYGLKFTALLVPYSVAFQYSFFLPRSILKKEISFYSKILGQSGKKIRLFLNYKSSSFPNLIYSLGAESFFFDVQDYYFSSLGRKFYTKGEKFSVRVYKEILFFSMNLNIGYELFNDIKTTFIPGFSIIYQPKDFKMLHIKDVNKLSSKNKRTILNIDRLNLYTPFLGLARNLLYSFEVAKKDINSFSNRLGYVITLGVVLERKPLKFINRSVFEVSYLFNEKKKYNHIFNNYFSINLDWSFLSLSFYLSIFSNSSERVNTVKKALVIFDRIFYMYSCGINLLFRLGNKKEDTMIVHHKKIKEIYKENNK